jgi:hypothetical protein
MCNNVAVTINTAKALTIAFRSVPHAHNNNKINEKLEM